MCTDAGRPVNAGQDTAECATRVASAYSVGSLLSDPVRKWRQDAAPKLRATPCVARSGRRLSMKRDGTRHEDFHPRPRLLIGATRQSLSEFDERRDRSHALELVRSGAFLDQREGTSIACLEPVIPGRFVNVVRQLIQREASRSSAPAGDRCVSRSRRGRPRAGPIRGRPGTETTPSPSSSRSTSPCLVRMLRRSASREHALSSVRCSGGAPLHTAPPRVHHVREHPRPSFASSACSNDTHRDRSRNTNISAFVWRARNMRFRRATPVVGRS